MKRNRRKKIWAYLDGKKLVEVIRAALDNNMSVADMKKLLIKENPGHEVTFKIQWDLSNKTNWGKRGEQLRNVDIVDGAKDINGLRKIGR